MLCHNGSTHDDYTGPGIEDPHPFGDTAGMACSTCHGGDPEGQTPQLAHVPRPPEIGDDENLENNTTAYFNRLTLTGIDRFADYTVDGVTYTALDYLQFINPGDLRVVSDERSCGACHEGHAECVEDSLLATSSGVFSGAMFAAGIDNWVPENRNLYEDTAADLGFRTATDEEFDILNAEVGEVGRLVEYPVYSARNDFTGLHNNDAYDAAALGTFLRADNSIQTATPLADLYHEQVAFTCGDCHLGSAGANNRTGDYRSSGCTACHMAYSLGGRSGSGDPNVNAFEPLDPDDIRAPEQPHIARHVIRSVAKQLPSGETLEGIGDLACAGCHQGSNRTVMQFWGIRLDQNEDVRRNRQYPSNPVSWQGTENDTRLFDPALGNREFNGRDSRQYLAFEDYDGDTRDDTPPDIHHQAGMGCIDCHGSFDLHGGDVNNPGGGRLVSRMEQATAISCVSCHGDAQNYAATTSATTYGGVAADVGVDERGNPLRHVTREADGNYFLTSRLTGSRHYLVQTRDVVVDSGRTNPLTSESVYSEAASYAMGRADGDPSTGIGPQQTAGVTAGFSHADSLSCESCHSSWTNSCIGCHLSGEYDLGNNFSNISGQRIVFEEKDADFVYQSPVPFQLGIDTNGRIAPISPNTEVFWYYEDKENDRSDIFSFSDRNGGGNNDAAGYPSLSHNVMMPHSIRGKVDANNEGPRNCASCHLTDSGLAAFGTEYAALRGAMQANDFSGLDEALFNTLRQHIGENTGNTLNSPLWVHQVAGLGSGLFLFDENGCPINPLDDNEFRVGCEEFDEDGNIIRISPRDRYLADGLTTVRFNLDRIVSEAGESRGSNNHPMQDGQPASLRDGAANPVLSGPLGQTLIERLTNPTTGIVLDSWFDADGQPQGDVGDFTNE